MRPMHPSGQWRSKIILPWTLQKLGLVQRHGRAKKSMTSCDYRANRSPRHGVPERAWTRPWGLRSGQICPRLTALSHCYVETLQCPGDHDAMRLENRMIYTATRQTSVTTTHAAGGPVQPQMLSADIRQGWNRELSMRSPPTHFVEYVDRVSILKVIASEGADTIRLCTEK